VTAAARPDRSWELFPQGLLVFEREPSPPAPSRLLVSHLKPCTQIECTCRDVALRAISLDVVDRDFDRAGLTTDGLRSRFASPEAMNATVDVDLGLVQPDDREGRTPLPAEWVEYVQSQVDGELLDLLHEQWLRAKGVTPHPQADWPSRDPSELVGWDEAHPDDREDLYLDGGSVFIAEDLYCLNPTCTCRDIMVVFRPAARGSPDIGFLSVRLPDAAVVERHAEPTKAPALERLWKAFQARHRRLTERLENRRQQMTELGRTRAHPAPKPLPVRSADRIGRNALCPCGSGKKYKRCCGAA
jgi:SEC-C motif domain protein